MKSFTLLSLLLHSPLLLLFFCVPTLTFHPAAKPIQTRTVSIQPEKIAMAKPPQVKKAPPPKKNTPPKKSKPPKKTPTKPQKKEEKKPALNSTQKERLQTLRRELKQNKSVATEKLSFAETGESYGKTLTQELKKRLILPEYGAVKIALEISATGQITSLKVLSSESEKNKKMILETLKNARMPTPPPGRSPQTFVVTLTS